jgi:hypothetical protein
VIIVENLLMLNIQIGVGAVGAAAQTPDGSTQLMRLVAAIFGSGSFIKGAGIPYKYWEYT